MRRATVALALVFATAVAPVAGPASATPSAAAVRPADVDAADVKAAYVLNFAKLVEWPAGTFRAPDQPLVIETVGDGALGDSLARLLLGQTVGGRAIQVRRTPAPTGAGLAQVVVVTSEGGRSLAGHPGLRAGSGVLVVCEDEDAMAMGGTIRFVAEGARVRFAIDPVAAERGGLRLSSKLLSLALPRSGPETRKEP